MRGPFRVVLAELLESRSREFEGWSILETYQADVTASELEQHLRDGWARGAFAPQSFDHSRGVYCDQNRQEQILSRRFVVLAQSPDDERATMRAKTASAEARASEESRKRSEIQAGFETLKKECDLAKKNAAEFERAEARERARATEHGERLYRMESDMGKVRGAIGDREWRRILAGEHE